MDLGSLVGSLMSSLMGSICWIGFWVWISSVGVWLCWTSSSVFSTFFLIGSLLLIYCTMAISSWRSEFLALMISSSETGRTEFVIAMPLRMFMPICRRAKSEFSCVYVMPMNPSFFGWTTLGVPKHRVFSLSVIPLSTVFSGFGPPILLYMISQCK